MRASRGQRLVRRRCRRCASASAGRGQSAGTRHGRREAGLTLIELFVALGVLAFGLLMLAVMQMSALRGGSAGRHQSDAARIARDQMEQIQRMPFATLSAAASVGWVTPPWVSLPGFNAGEMPVQAQLPDGTGALEQLYTVAWRVTSVPGETSLLGVDVEVSWAERNLPNLKPTRTGLPSVTLSSMRYDW